MKKRLISFSDDGLAWLQSEAAKWEISVSEFVRRLTDEARSKAERRKRAAAIVKRAQRRDPS